MHHLRLSLSHIIGSILPQDCQKMADLFFDWPKIMGDFVGRHTHPLRWKQNTQGYTLWIRVPTGSAMELQYYEPLIRERITQYLGKNQNIRIFWEPIQKKASKPQSPSFSLARNAQTEKTIQEIADPKLREAYEHWYQTSSKGL